MHTHSRHTRTLRLNQTCTHSNTHKLRHTNNQTLSDTRTRLRQNQKPGTHRPAHTWFKNCLSICPTHHINSSTMCASIKTGLLQMKSKSFRDMKIVYMCDYSLRQVLHPINLKLLSLCSVSCRSLLKGGKNHNCYIIYLCLLLHNFVCDHVTQASCDTSSLYIKTKLMPW